MKSQTMKTQGPLSLTELLQGVSDSPQKGGETRRWDVYRRNQLSGGKVCFGEQLIELVVPPSATPSQLMRFTVRLEEKLRHHDSCGDILRMIPSWSHGTAFTVMLQAAKLKGLLAKLANMSEIEKIEEELPVAGALSSPTKRFQVRLAPLTLVETGVAELQLVTAA